VMALVSSDGWDVEGLANAINLADHGLKLADLVELKQLFEHATTFGSLIQVPDGLSQKLPALRRLSELKGQDMLVAKALKCLEPLARQAELLAAQYDEVAANPPYMGSKYHMPSLKNFLKSHFPRYEKDIFSASIVRNLALSKPHGRLGFMSPFVWMFISSHGDLRTRLLDHETITSLIQLEYSGFEGATVPICTFTLSKGRVSGQKGCFIRLSNFRGAANQAPKTLEAIHNRDCGWFFEVSQDEFKKIPGTPLAYWASKTVLDIYTKGTRLDSIVEVGVGLQTGDNGRFIREWHEPSIDRIGLSYRSADEALASGKKWFACNKGGEYRKWYGNQADVINWEGNGAAIKSNSYSQRTYLLRPSSSVVHGY